MNINKLKIATGVIGLIAVATTFFYAFSAMPYAANHVPEGGSLPLLFMALYFILVIVAFCILAFMQLVYSIIYIIVKPKRNAFFIIGCVFSAFDILNLFLIIFTAFIVTSVVVGGIFPLIAALSALPVALNIALRIACAVRFKCLRQEENNIQPLREEINTSNQNNSEEE